MEDFTFPFKISTNEFKHSWNKQNLIAANTIVFAKQTMSAAFKKFVSLE